MTNNYDDDVRLVLEQLRNIHEEQTRRLVDQILELRNIEKQLKKKKKKDSVVDSFVPLLRNLK